jgi:uncharacterized membrane protein
MMLRANIIHRLFQGGLALKGINAAIEAVGGITLLFVRTSTLVHFIESMTQDELHHVRHDIVANTFMHLANEISVSNKQFFAYYLAAHGIIKIIIVIGLLREKMWMFPVGLTALGCFVTYQLYRFSIGHSVGLLIVTIFDILIMWFVWREWGVKRSQMAPAH